MADGTPNAEAQQTISGDRLDLQPAECEYHAVCSHPAQVVVEQLVYGAGVVETLACRICASEFREYGSEEKIRELKASEKWANA